ncbi:uncharacterized protein AC631_05294 [Debaryomyces fabryi]|uniref:Major facilitator superfamily (MFS) profile domain-containing protein n=1 Tax=Debaryomyces fabryi TaxID=58627 RepID=A0A0V1PRX4_9ASCO|nr:uncharacterized protein AC631_05294 [Debaryomyces fabryi]KRZ98954.1 hypothetical protein AC631_05294 [Debaryomyces fabryi]CUM56769.1 unnamed protein product [Debaryomyces fabryi]
MNTHTGKQSEISKSTIVSYENDVQENDAYEKESTDSNKGDWTSKEEKYVVLKVDFVVLLLLTLGLTVFQFDRMNLASALTGGFKEDVHVTQSEINTGNELMFLGIFLLEIPSNMLLMKFGPRKWLPFQILVFGFVAIMQIFLKNRSGFYASRFMLGIAESGYIPGACYIISNWYVLLEFSSLYFIKYILVHAIICNLMTEIVQTYTNYK